MCYDENGTSPLWFCSLKLITPTDNGKNITQIQTRGHSTKIWPLLLKTVKVIRNKEKSKELLQSREAQDNMTKRNMVPWNRIKTLGKNERNLNKIKTTLVNFNKCTTLRKCLTSEETGYGIYGNSLWYFCNFSVNQKLSQNKKLI